MYMYMYIYTYVYTYRIYIYKDTSVYVHIETYSTTLLLLITDEVQHHRDQDGAGHVDSGNVAACSSWPLCHHGNSGDGALKPGDKMTRAKTESLNANELDNRGRFRQISQTPQS